MDAIIFARVSSREQEDGYSLDAQINRLEAYCKRTDLRIIQRFVITESSTRGERTQFYDMLDFIKKQKTPIAIVCDKVDRLQRSFKEVPILDELRKKGKISLHFYTENQVIDKDSTSMQLMTYHLYVMLAESYTNAISDNVKRSQQQMIKEGKWGHKAPIGYKNTLDSSGKPTVIADPVTGNLVAYLFKEYASGLFNVNQLLIKARKLGIKSSYGKNLCKQTLLNMLRNPFYYGEMSIKGQIYKHIYPPLISKEVFNQCQNVLDGKKFHKQRKYVHVFQKLVICRHCGSLVSTDVKIKNGKEYKYLFCPKCKSYVNEQSALNEVEKYLNTFGSIPSDVYNVIIKHLEKEIETENRLELTKRSQLEKNYKDIEVKKERLLDALLEGHIIQELYTKKLHELDEKSKELEDELLNYNTLVKQTTINLNSLIKLVSHANKLFKISKNDEKRKIIHTLFSKIELDGKNIIFSTRKPLEVLTSGGSRQDWLGNLEV